MATWNSSNDCHYDLGTEIQISALNGVVIIQSHNALSTGYIKFEADQWISQSVGTASLEIFNELENGSIMLGTSGPEGTISLCTPGPGLASSLGMSPEGLFLCSGPGEAPAAITMNAEKLELSMGPPGTGSMITMTDESITFKVGEVVISITPEGIVSTSPTVEINCEDTNISISAEGINEQVAEVTREMNVEGHNFTAAETEFNVGVEGFVGEGPVKASETEGAEAQNSTMHANIADAMDTRIGAILITA